MTTRQTTHGFALTILGVGLLGLVGPIIRWLAWPPGSIFDEAREQFIYNFLVLVWPVWRLAAVEVNVGFFMAGVHAVGGNFLVFAILGAVIATASRSGRSLTITYVVTVFVVTVWAVFMTRFGYGLISFVSYAVAIGFYSIPFLVVARFRKRQESAG